MTPQETRKAADIMCKAYDDGYDAGYAKAQARIKELEAALRGVLTEFGTQPAHDGWYDACVYKHEVEHARAILNKK